MSEQENIARFSVVCDDCGMEGEECHNLPIELMTLAVFWRRYDAGGAAAEHCY